MAFDLIVLIIASWALFRLPGRSNLWNLLIIDGLSYFAGEHGADLQVIFADVTWLAAFVSYLTVVIIALAAVSPILTYMVSDIGACLRCLWCTG